MKSINQILKKYGVKSVGKSQRTQPLSRNNLSRKVFKQFCAMNDYKPLGLFNAFEKEGKVFGFSLCATYTPECRQFGRDYAGLVCQFPDGSVKSYDRCDLLIGALTRIDTFGSSYFNVKGLVNPLTPT